MKNRWIFLILTTLLLLSATLSTAIAAPASSTPLEMSSEDTVASAQATVGIGEMAYFSFTPTVTGYYSIFPDYLEGLNEPYLMLFDANLNELTSKRGNTFSDLTFKLIAGTPYYIGATVYDEGSTYSTLFTVNALLIQGLISASAESMHMGVAAGQPFTMKVNVQKVTGAKLNYQWEEQDSDTGELRTIPDAGTASCTIQEPKRGWYYCTVSDQYGRSKQVSIEVYIENELTADDPESIRVPYGETTVLEVHASCLAGELRYQWFFGLDGEFMEGETEPSLETVPITTQTRYECTVYDDYENAISIIFDVNVDNHLRVTQALINGETLKAYDFLPFNFYTNASFLPETPIIAEVNAVCDQGELHYSWSDETGNSLGIHQPILTYGPLKASVSLRCTIEDDFGNTEVVTLHISMNNNVTATYVSGIHDSYIDESIESTVITKKGTSCDLTVEASCAVGDVHYRWYIVEDDTYSLELIKGQTDSTLTIAKVDYACHYRCVVNDDYPDSYDDFTADFYVLVDNLVIEDPGSDIESGYYHYLDLICTAPGQSLVLSVKAYVKQGRITYMWYRDDFGSRILSHTSSVSIANVTGDHFYFCRITDDFGNRATISFKVTANNGLYAEPVLESCFALPGQNAEFAVHTSVIMGPLTFKWYDSDGNLLPSTSDIATVQAPAERGEYTYTCQVKDAYENKRTAEFTLIVGEPYTLSPGQSITVTPDLPYAYFSFAANETAFYSFTVSGQANRAKLELFDLPGDDYHRSRDQMVQRLYSGRNYYYRVETASPSFTAALERIPDIPCGDCTLRKGQQVILPASIGEEDLTVNLCESADPPILSVSDHTASAQAEGETLLYAICDGQQGVYRITVADPQDGIFTLPANLTILGGSAFAGIAGIRYAELNEALPVLPAGAFGDADLVQLVVHGKQTVIEDGAFSGKPLILCPEGSQAAEYAREKGLPWLYLAKEN